MSAQTFLLNPQNGAVPPSRLGHYLIALFMLPFVVAGVYLASIAIAGGCMWFAFERTSIRAEAVVTKLWIEKGGDSDVHHVAYEYGLYPTDDRTLQGGDTVSEDFYRQLMVGGQVTVRYLAGRPAVSSISGYDRWWSLLMFAIMWNGSIAFVTVAVVKSRLRERRLRRGRVLPGEVTGTNGSMDGEDYHVTVEYRFLLPDGRALRGKTTRIRNDLKQRSLPDSGTPVLVRYADSGEHDVS
jgi:hypothetical protein